MSTAHRSMKLLVPCKEIERKQNTVEEAGAEEERTAWDDTFSVTNETMIWGEGVTILVTTCGGAGADYEKSNTDRMTADAKGLRRAGR